MFDGAVLPSNNVPKSSFAIIQTVTTRTANARRSGTGKDMQQELDKLRQEFQQQLKKEQAKAAKELRAAEAKASKAFQQQRKKEQAEAAFQLRAAEAKAAKAIARADKGQAKLGYNDRVHWHSDGR